MPYTRLLSHTVWSTKFRQPIIDDEMAMMIREAIERTSRELEITIYAIGVMPEHVHVFAQIRPSLTIAKVIGRWKGASSNAVNAARPA